MFNPGNVQFGLKGPHIKSLRTTYLEICNVQKQPQNPWGLYHGTNPAHASRKVLQGTRSDKSQYLINHHLVKTL
jgi:hypothetical protein